MNTKMKMRMISFLLCFMMLVGLMPTTVFAWTAPTLSGGKAEWNIRLSDEGVLTWNDMGSATYDIQVDETSMGGTVTKIQGISGTSYNLINRFKELKLENGTYYFYIKANDTDATSGDVSFKYVSPEPKLSAPQNLRWEGTVAKWDSVANATGYEVRLYSDSGSLQLNKTTTGTQYDWSTNVYNGGFWFEVVATADSYRNSNAAEGPKYGTYSWTAPTLSGGKAEWGVTLSNDGLLRWNNMGSATYDIYVDESEMGGTVTKINNVNTNAYNLINRLKELKIENGIYYFYIQANDTDATSGDIRFTYVSPEPKLSAPQNLRWEGTVAKWDSVANATEYTVRLYSDSGSLQLNKTTSGTQYDWSTNVYNDGFWFEVIATGNGYRDSSVAESPKYFTVGYSIGAYPYDATVSQTQAGGQVYLSTGEGTDGWSGDGYIKTAAEGSTVTLNAMPATGYRFVEWRQGTAGATVSTNASYQFVASEDKYLYAVFQTIETTEYQIELQVFDITYTASAGGTLKLETNKGSAEGANPRAYATKGTAVTITAVPAEGYAFVAWKKYTPHYSTAFSTEATYTFTATDPAVIPSDDPPLFLYAVFQEVQQVVPTYEINCVSHNLSSSEIGGKVYLETDKGGSGYAASQQKHATENTTVKVRAVAEPGYQFVAWRKGSPSDANATVSTNAEYVFTATEAVWMYAIFEYTPECTIDCTVFDITNGINNGQIGVGGTVSIQTDKGSVEGATPLPIQATRNSSVTVNAVAASGYEFLGWKKASPYVQDFVSTTATYTFDINEELYLYAVFQESAIAPTYTVSFAANGGTGTMADVTGISGEYTLPENGFGAPSGKLFKAWSVNGVEKAAGDKITVNANTVVKAVWEDNEIIFCYNANGAEGSNELDYATVGAEITLADCMFTAPNGKRFKAWAIGSVNGEQKQPGDKIIINAELYIYAIWEDIPHTCVGVAESGQGATCTENGWKDYYRCECGKYYEDANCQTPISDLEAWKVGDGKITAAHSGTPEWTKTATTHEKKYTCCGEAIVAEEAHEWNSGTCFECGYVCLHTNVAVTKKDGQGATCTVNGWKDYYQCACGKYFANEARTTPIADLDLWKANDGKIVAEHKYGDLIEKQSAVHTQTELKAGMEAHYKCSVCQAYFDANKNLTTEGALKISKPEHHFGEWIKDDEKHWKVCSCGLKADEHTHSYTNNADMICNDCGYDRTVPHTCGNATKQSGQGATCTVNGWKDYYKCSCGKLYTEAACTNEITSLEAWKNGYGKIAAGHSYGNLISKVDADCSATGMLAHYECSVCHTLFDENKVVKTQNELTVAIDATAHTYGAWTSNGDGTHTRVCSLNATHQENGSCEGGTATCTEKAMCVICNAAYGKTAEHNYSPEWKTDANEHWNECECGDETNRAVHADSNSDGKCDTCEYQMSTAPNNPDNTPNQPDNTPDNSGNNSDDPTDEEDGLGVGAIVGIVIGSIVVVGAGLSALVWFVIKKKSFADLVAVFKK